MGAPPPRPQPPGDLRQRCRAAARTAARAARTAVRAARAAARAAAARIAARVRALRAAPAARDGGAADGADDPGLAPGFPLHGAATVVAGRDDDAGSIVGRIDAAEEVDVLLVVPRRAQGLRDAMEWPRIAAHARRRGLQLQVVTSRGDVRRHAGSVGLPVARTPRGLRPRPGLRLPLGNRRMVLRAPPAGRAIRAAAFAGVVFLGGFAFCTYVPSAEILIAPPAEPVEVTRRVRLAPAGETDIAFGVVAAATVRASVVSVVSTAATGSASVGDEPATAGLVFTNASESALDLPAGTVVRDEDGVTFTTGREVAVPAGGSASVGATALRPGSEGNLAAGSLRVIEGYPTLGVTNPEPASGGTDIEVPAVSALDVERVGDLAGTVLRRAGERELTATIENATIFPQTLSVTILDGDPLFEVGEQSEVFAMEYTAAVTVLVLPQDEADRAAGLLLQGELPEGMALLPGTAAASVGADAAAGPGLSVDLTATGQAARLFDPAELGGALTGVSAATAAARLRERLGLAADPLITVHPAWIPGWRMPRRADRITITLVSAEALAEAAAGGAAGADGGAEAGRP